MIHIVQSIVQWRSIFLQSTWCAFVQVFPTPPCRRKQLIKTITHTFDQSKFYGIMVSFKMNLWNFISKSNVALLKACNKKCGWESRHNTDLNLQLLCNVPWTVPLLHQIWSFLTVTRWPQRLPQHQLSYKCINWKYTTHNNETIQKQMHI